MQTLRVAIAHDYVTQRGGAERVASTLAQAYPGAPLYTALYNSPTTFPEFKTISISASLLNRVGLFRRNPQLALPLLHFAWSLRRRIDADVVVASSSGWSHAVRVGRKTLKVVYCHNPPRWLYQRDDYLQDRSFPVRGMLRMLAPLLRTWDRKAALTADLYLANSTSVAERIKRVYNIEAEVLHPPIALSGSGRQVAVEGLSAGFFLTVGRKRGYKGTDQLIDAFRSLPEEELVVVGGSDLELPPNVRVLSDISDAELRWLYRNAKAFTSVSREDFGLSPLEANSFGTPCLLVKAGGFIDSTLEGISGIFFQGASTGELVASIRDFPEQWNEEAIIQHARHFNSDAFLSKLDNSIRGALKKKLTRQGSVLGPRSSSDANIGIVER